MTYMEALIMYSRRHLPVREYPRSCAPFERAFLKEEPVITPEYVTFIGASVFVPLLRR